MVRAKFRCMRVSQQYDGQWSAEFRPVWRHSGPDPENTFFWEATPSGEADLWWRPAVEDAPRFLPGAYYYIDMEQVEAGTWGVSMVTLYSGGSGQVVLSTHDKKENGKLSMNLSKPEVLALFGSPGSRWSVTFRFAEASAD